MAQPKTYRTQACRTLSAKDLEAIADQVEHKDYDVEALQ